MNMTRWMVITEAKSTVGVPSAVRGGSVLGPGKAMRFVVVVVVISRLSIEMPV